ncbi:Uncharacterised protein [marine metagenome]
MTSKKHVARALPALPSRVDPELKPLLTAIKEVLEVQVGHRGEDLDKAVTFRDLTDSGIATYKAESNGSNGISSVLEPVVKVGVQTAPPNPVTLTASATFTNVLLSWSGGFRHDLVAATEVYRSTSDNLSAASHIGSTSSFVYTDTVEPASTHYYWIRFISPAGVPGAYNATDGTVATTSKSVASILSDLNESIGVTSLDTALADNLATIGTIGTSVTEHTSALGDLVGEQYIKIDGFGSVAGYGISASAGGSEFAVKADVFKISNGASKILPFVVTGGATYINTAYIQDASIDVAKIANLTVDMAQVTGTLTANQINTGLITSDKINAAGISADRIKIDGNIEFQNTQSGVQFGKTSLGSTTAGAFFGRSGGVAGFHISSATSGIYADSSGTVALNNVRLYTGAAGSAVEYPNPGQVTQALNISALTPRLFLTIIGGGGGSCNAGVFNPPYGKLAGAAGGGSYVQWFSGLNGTGALMQTTSAEGGAGVAAGSVGSNRSSASGVAGQASSKAAGGTAGNYSGGAGGHGSFGSGGGGPAGTDTYNGSSNAPVNVSASAGVTFSQNVDVPIQPGTGNRAQSIKIFVGYGGAGGQGFSEFIGGNDNVQGANVAAGGNGGNGFVSVADPNSGGIEVDLLNVLSRLTALEG